jgi:predicted MPP superfamily phosphohydrolase
MRLNGRMLAGVGIFFAFFTLLDIYLSGGIRAAAGAHTGVLMAFWLMYWGMTGATVWMIWEGSRVGGNREGALKGAGTLFILWLVPALVFGILLLGEDLYRLLHALILGLKTKFSATQSDGVDYFPLRSVLYNRIALVLAMLPFAGILYGITKGKYRYKVHRTELRFPDLPAAFDGFTITQLSDIHAGSFHNRNELIRAIDLVNEQKSDVILFTGDMVNNTAAEMTPWMDVFGKLKAPMGKYSVLGNHDYGDYVAWPSAEQKRANLAQLVQVHRDLGFQLMRNENTRIDKGGSYLDLLGIENWGGGSFAKYGDLNLTLDGLAPNSFRILMSHDPSHWEQQVKDAAHKIHLTLSGHTHGMQFGFEWGRFRFSPIQFRYKRWAGLYAFNKQYLYVNRGFGFLGFPGRVGIWPEITVITLRKG